MTNIKVVIGSNFGDEGKGLMTDYFCHQATSSGLACLNVLGNGGAQRGHTVVDPSGNRHVFKHFGAGTMAGADTYYTSDFILNPMEFRRESEELEAAGIKTPFVYYCANCRWSTPYDMIINQIAEECREHKKHGSCGMGIWETIVRYQKNPNIPTLSVFRWMPYEDQVEYLKSIRDNYMSMRLKEHGIKSIPAIWKDIVYSDALINNFIYDVIFMYQHCSERLERFMRHYEHVVFENGQGLLLDQNQTYYGDNTTPSNTGIANPFGVINRVFDKANLEVCYVSRTYMTRHGAGKFNEECNKDLINKDMVDETNGTNQFQGELRYGELDVQSLLGRVNDDLQPLHGSRFNWSATFGITHTNEAQFDYSLLKGGNVKEVYVSDNRDRTSVKLFRE